MTGKGQTQIPNWLKGYLQEKDLAEISQAISQAESRTTGEIVPMVVERSSTVRHIPISIGLFLFSCILLLDVSVQWKAHWESQYEWGVFVTPFAALICYGVGLLLSRAWIIQRLFIPNYDEIHQVEVRAELEFHRLNMAATQQRTGILIFASMMERRVVVLADQGIAKVLPSETWKDLVGNLIIKLKQKDLKSGILEAVTTCGALLNAKLPAQNHDSNEIANDLVIKA